MPYRNQGRVPLVPGGGRWGLLLALDPTAATIIAAAQQVLLVVVVIVRRGRWGPRCLGGCRRGGGGRRGGRGGSRCGGLGVLARLPGALAMLDEAQELQGALPLPVGALSSASLIAAFAAQVVLAADGDASPQALHDGTVHSWGDGAPSQEARPGGRP